MKALLIDPATASQREIDFDGGDWRSIQRLIGGVFDYFVLRDDRGAPIALVYCADDVRARSNMASFAFSDVAVLENGWLHYGWPVIGTGILVAFDGCRTSDYAPGLMEGVAGISFHPDPSAARLSSAFKSIEANGATYIANPVYERQLSGMLGGNVSHEIAAFADALGGKPRDPLARLCAETGGLDPNRAYVEHLAERKPRDFIPRPTGSFTNQRCSATELEAAYLGLHEWARKRRSSAGFPVGAFDAPPFFFPEGLEFTEEDFNAARAVVAGDLSLPFPMTAFWVVRWDMWLDGGKAFEGPVMLYVEGCEAGFSTCEAHYDKCRGYSMSTPEHHDRLTRSPSMLVAALHRINNRRYVVEALPDTPERQQINAGRARSKLRLDPLPSFIAITGRVTVGREPSSNTGAERCRHNRRAHWRKRRKGVELAPQDWIRVRSSTIRPDKSVRPLKPYVVM